MTQAEWLACEPAEMYRLAVDRLGSSARRKDLFCLACARLIWDLLGDEARRPFEWLEEHVGDREKPGHAGRRHVRDLFEGPARSLYQAHHRRESGTVAGAAAHVAYDFWAGWYSYAFPNLFKDYEVFRELLREDPRYSVVSIVRDIFGDPFRAAALAPSVLAWNDGTVPRIARGIYDERAFDRLPALADTLHDAGCEDEELLGHCRGGATHVRGCWAVDLMLGWE